MSSIPEAERQTRRRLQELFELHGYHPRTPWGQNFLIDLNIVEFVIRSAELSPLDVVLEVGAGTGGLTTSLAREAGHVVSVEIDRNMHRLASSALAQYSNVDLLNIDALRNKNNLAPAVLEAVDAALTKQARPQLKLVANLPYNIATPVISNLVATELPWTRMVVTIQYEVGLRMQAGPGSEHYGALSAWLQSQCQVEILKKIGPTVFWPRPKVDSAIVLITPDPVRRARLQDRAFFHEFVRGAFQHRRKLLRSVLIGMYRHQLSKPEVDAVLIAAGLPDNVRAEQLSPEQLISLSQCVQSALATANK